uniref:Uncharacterized protein n=1 Tax=Ditylenchus dipsaci TaxID=166011 RepID=A0A915DE99_9BILA
MVEENETGIQVMFRSWTPQEITKLVFWLDRLRFYGTIPGFMLIDWIGVVCRDKIVLRSLSKLKKLNPSLKKLNPKPKHEFPDIERPTSDVLMSEGFANLLGWFEKSSVMLFPRSPENDHRLQILVNVFKISMVPCTDPLLRLSLGQRINLPLHTVSLADNSCRVVALYYNSKPNQEVNNDEHTGAGLRGDCNQRFLLSEGSSKSAEANRRKLIKLIFEFQSLRC